MSSYYLSIKNKKILDLSSINGLQQTTNYLPLNLFIMSFQTQDELVSFLKSIYPEENFTYTDLSIVMKKNRRDSFAFLVTEFLPEAADLCFLNPLFMKDYIVHSQYKKEIFLPICLEYLESFNQILKSSKINDTFRSNLNYLITLLNNAIYICKTDVLIDGDGKNNEESLNELIDKLLNNILYSSGKINYREFIKIAKYLSNKSRLLGDKFNEFKNANYSNIIGDYQIIIQKVLENGCLLDAVELFQVYGGENDAIPFEECIASYEGPEFLKRDTGEDYEIDDFMLFNNDELLYMDNDDILREKQENYRKNEKVF